MDEGPQAPIRTLSYRLTRADALAYRLLRHELTGWEKFRLLVIVGCGGLVIGLVPDDLPPLAWWTVAAAIMALSGAVAVGWSNIAVRRAAAAMQIPDGVVELEEWGDHLAERSGSGVRHVALQAIAQVIRTDRHVFVREGEIPLIIPATAFDGDEDMRLFAEGLDEASERAQP